ncbi:putative glucose/sorbosone dehydrogenase [Methylocella silvestris BL2]|uniref:Putative glucose/sorbosone dehydrogenase n=1 Tax=Methylocella silvestris (strain DSM 15510 / CIP 108128 / LMG 27833 / NCIMB 13906 / BL2) TaxID=395965 RepID=B8EMZ4_METSB|nr:PQQ-dependent sugar dehydrogenase [Methylocella silvestris]ACK49129.1 putative glucose/sorbosone dehydrogenase [Methylocella silvestris BL2]
MVLRENARRNGGCTLMLGALALFGLVLGPAWAQETAPTPAAPEMPLDPGMAARHAAAARLKPNLAKIKLPPGFEISVFTVAPGARTIAVGPQGKAIFIGTKDEKIFVAPYRHEQTFTDEVSEFVTSANMKMPHGLCFAPDGTLFVAEQNRILSYANAEWGYHDPFLPAETVVAQGKLIPAQFESTNHSTRVCRVGADGKLYVSLGQPYNVPPKDKQANFVKLGIGAIIRMNRDGSEREIFANGIRNSVGLDFNPADQTLWFTDNQVDQMGDDRPPGELNRATAKGQNFGFPWYGGGHVRTDEYKDEAPPAGLVFPQVEMDAHAADLGMIFYRGAQFPSDYKGGIFSAQHGSWNRTTPIGARIMFTPVKPDGTAGKARVFAEGWLEKDGSYWGRPVDVAELPDGSLLVSDDYNGVIYRIARTQQ